MSSLLKDRPVAWKRHAQLAVVLLCAFALKLYYCSASADDLRWILAPTTALVAFISRRSFAFESHAGYLSGDRSFLIAASCAGVNFLITSFLMLTLRKLWRDRSQGSSRNLGWSFIPIAALFAYLATLVANTARISIALWLQRHPLGAGWLSASQLHRLEGIFVYFGFLLLLFVVSEKLSARAIGSRASLENTSGLPKDTSGLLPTVAGLRQYAGRSRGQADRSSDANRPLASPSLFRRSLFPLTIYYLTALGIPLANSIYHRGVAANDFREHSLFVLLTPLLLILTLGAFRLYNSWSTAETRPNGSDRCKNFCIEKMKDYL